MSITAITIENFKGIREPVRVELKPITLLFGPNSAGKSTIIQALHYAREIFERQNLNPDRTLLGGDSIDLGGFTNLVYGHDKSLPIRLTFELNPQKEVWPEYIENGVQVDDTEMGQHESAELWDATDNLKSVAVCVEIKWSEQFEEPYIWKYSIWVNQAKLIEIESKPDGRRVQITFLHLVHQIFLDDKTEKTIDATGDTLKRLFKDYRKLLRKIDETIDDPNNLSNIDYSGWETVGPWARLVIRNTNTENGLLGVSKPIELSGQKTALPRWGKPLGIDENIFFPSTEKEVIFNFISALSTLAVGPGELVRDSLRKLCYVGPLRQIPKRGHQPATSPDESRWSNGLAAYDTLFFSDDAFIDKVNEWLTQEERLGSGYSVEVKKYRELEADNPLMLAVLQGRILDEDMDLRDSLLSLPVMRRLLIRDEARNIELAPQDIGVGISQVLPVVVAALYHKTGLVAIEQPELHIHPAFQVALGDLFIEQVRQCPDLTFILETHSEHLMLRFLRRIRETGEDKAPGNRTLTPAELAIYFIEQGETGISCLPIRVDEDGDFIDRWPKGFFNERVKELY